MTALKLLLASLMLSASLSLFAQPSPRFIDKSILVQSRVLPSDYQLFLPDTASQILFNPARAALGGRQFAYSTYLPTLIGQTFSGQSLVLASFFEVGGGKYVAQASHSSERISFDTKSLFISRSLSVPSLSQSERVTNSERVSITNTFSIARTWESGVSFGVFGVVNPSSSKSSSTNVSELTFSRSVSERINTFDFSQYAFGLEFGVARSSWDFIGTIGYEFGKQTSIFDDRDSALSNPPNSTPSGFSNLIIASGTSDPKGISAKAYFQHAIKGLSERDHFFLSATGGYYWQSKRGLYNAKRLEIPGALFMQIQRDKDTTANLRQTVLTLSLGYIVRPKLDDIELLLGLNPFGSYQNQKDLFPPAFISSGGAINENTENRDWSIGARVPFYASYQASDWCRLFGSFVFDITYSHLKETASTYFEERVLFSQASVPPGDVTYLKDLSEFRSSLLLTSQVFNFGVDLRHKSGVNVQLLFGSDLAQFQSWNVSVGYLF